MDIGIGAAGAGQIPSLPEGGAGGLAPAGAEGTDVERLQAALSRPDAQSAETPEAAAPATGPAETAAREAAKPGEPSMGDRILAGMESLSEKIQAGRAEAVSILEKPETTHTDLLKANMAILETGTIVTAASKTTEKITQAVKTLQQG